MTEPKAVRIVQISDTHLTHRGGVTNENFELLVEFINRELRPDLVVNSGDLSLLSPDDEADREMARHLHERLEAPVRVVPGNHDVGEVGADPWAGFGVTGDRIAAFGSTFGPDHWLEVVGDWVVLGINSEVLSSGLAEEAEQWEWFAGLPDEISDRPAMLFLHKPLWSPVPGGAERGLSVAEADRDRLLSLLGAVDLRAVGSGHLHRYQPAAEGDLITVTAPSTAFVAKTFRMGPGLEQLGVVEYRCAGREVVPRFRSIPTLDERQPYEIDEFVATWEEIGAGPLARRG